MFLPLTTLAKTHLRVNARSFAVTRPRASAFLFLLFPFTFFLILKAEALEVPPAPDTYVTDRADILAPETEARLELILTQFEEATSNQVVIATFPSLEGEALEDFSIRLAEKWGVGQKDKDNGVVLLVFRDDRQVRIEVGYGLEGALPDALAGQIIQTIIIPNFKAGQFDKGVLEGTKAILEAVQGEYKGTGVTQGTQEFSNKDAQGLVLIALIIAGALLILDIFRYGGYFMGHRLYPQRYSPLEWWIRFSLLLALLSVLLRLLFYALLSSRGGYSGSRGSSGFSGGGGSFGGGGASGRW